jgi:hypothetical protein
MPTPGGRLKNTFISAGKKGQVFKASIDLNCNQKREVRVGVVSSELGGWRYYRFESYYTHCRFPYLQISINKYPIFVCKEYELLTPGSPSGIWTTPKSIIVFLPLRSLITTRRICAMDRPLRAVAVIVTASRSRLPVAFP